jgi:hypothetical protein
VARDYGPYIAPAGTTNGILEVVLPLLMQHKHLFHISIAHTRLMYLKATGQPTSRDQELIHHHGLGLACLHEALSDVANDIEDAIPLAIMHLISFEWRLGNTNALANHYQGLQKVIELRGNRASTYALEVAMMLRDSASDSSIIRAEPAISRVVVLEPSKLVHEAGYAISHSLPTDLLPVGYRDLAAAGFISVPFLDALLRVTKPALAHILAQTAQKAYPSPPDERNSSAPVTTTSDFFGLSQQLSHVQTTLDRHLRYLILSLSFLQITSLKIRKSLARSAKDAIEDLTLHLANAGFRTELAALRPLESSSFSIPISQCHHVRDVLVSTLVICAGASERIRKDSEGIISRKARMAWATALDGDCVSLMQAARDLIDIKGSDMRDDFTPDGTWKETHEEWAPIRNILRRFDLGGELEVELESINGRALCQDR